MAKVFCRGAGAPRRIPCTAEEPMIPAPHGTRRQAEKRGLHTPTIRNSVIYIILPYKFCICKAFSRNVFKFGRKSRHFAANRTKSFPPAPPAVGLSESVGRTRRKHSVCRIKIFEGVKRGLFIKSPLLRVSLLAFLFVSFFFAPTPAKKKRRRNLMTL